MAVSAPPPLGAYGADPTRYRLIPRVLVIVTHGDRVLLIRRGLHKRLWPGLYNAPGGHVERGEEPYEAACRELAEETGVTPTRLQLRGLIVAETGLDETGILVFVYQGETDSTVLRSGAEGEAQWVARRDLAHINLLSDLPLILELTLDRPDFFYLYKTPTAEGETVRMRMVPTQPVGDHSPLPGNEG
ncbi:MAG: NUDIX domain-containing protein [Caldilineales bacterium]|nr:NUDIX domain-containing protein [Caldilineales bacterium]